MYDFIKLLTVRLLAAEVPIRGRYPEDNNVESINDSSDFSHIIRRY